MNDFKTATKLYPHHGSRSKGTAARAIWHELTTTGHLCVAKVDNSFIRLGKVTATEDELIEAIKALIHTTPADDLKYINGFQVWLHQARFLDHEDDERTILAEQYDNMQGNIERLKKDGKVRVVS